MSVVQQKAWSEGCLRLPEWRANCPLCPQVSEQPLMFLLDTPGVLAPRIESVETGLKLALCGEPPSGPHVRPSATLTLTRRPR